jgi:hypothetical protein
MRPSWARNEIDNVRRRMRFVRIPVNSPLLCKADTRSRKTKVVNVYIISICICPTITRTHHSLIPLGEAAVSDFVDVDKEGTEDDHGGTESNSGHQATTQHRLILSPRGSFHDFLVYWIDT